MKNLLLGIIGLVISVSSFAQAPNSFKYQAVARDASGNILENKSVALRVSILQGSSSGTAVYRETHSLSTNKFGLLNLVIGNGTSDIGSLTSLDWGAASYFLSIEMDPNGGSNYNYLGSSQLLSVPYALHANSVETDKVNDADADPTNEIQTLSLDRNELTLSKEGGTVIIPENSGDDWGSQIVLTDATLEGNGIDTTPLKIAQQGAGTGQVLKWNGSSWLPDNDLTGSSFWQQSGSNIFYNEGYVGIGTENPNHKFHIHSESLLSAVILTNTQSGTSNSDGMLMGMQYSNSLGTNISRVLSNENGPLYLGTNRTSQIAIAPNGDVGIGTLSPSTQLDVLGQIRIRAGSPGAGKVLTSDATGLASWETPSVTSPSLWQQSESNIFYNDGSVGIGTQNPAYDLHVHSDNSMTSFQLTNSYTGITVEDGLVLRSDYDDASIINKENTPMRLGVSNSSFLHIMPGMRFGVGTMLPQAMLDVAGTIKIGGGSPGAGKVLTSDPNGLASWEAPGGGPWSISGENIYTGENKLVGIGLSNPKNSLHLHTANLFTSLRLTNSTSGHYATDGLEIRFQHQADESSSFVSIMNNENTKMRIGIHPWSIINIQPNGNVGIFEANPDARLDVGGTIKIRGGSPGNGKILTSDATGLASWQTPDGNGWTVGGDNIYTSAGAKVGIGNASPGYKLDVFGNSRIRLIDPSNDWIALRTDGSPDFLDLSYSGGGLVVQGTADGENIILNPSKNSKVGIRNWVPAYTLDVNGDIRATGSVYYGGTVGNANGTAYIKPDFVFTDDYEVLSTKEVEKFVVKNNHLPWITSAKKEIKENKNAVNMTRMQFETVETIENLQLQIIELNKKIDTLSQLVYKQQKEIKKLRR